MAATNAPNGDLPGELRPRYYIQRDAITSTSYDNCQIIFPTAGSPSAYHLRNKFYVHEILTNMAATNASYDNHQWSYGLHFTPRPELSSLHHTAIIRLFFLRLVLRRHTTYATSFIYKKY